MPKKITKEEWISRFVELYGDKYDYSKSVFINSSTPIDIYCNIHKVYFRKRPDKHILNHRCKYCVYDIRKDTLEDFIRKAKIKHGDKYDYSLVDYKGTYEDINIICPIHSVFPQRPNDHLNGSGCPDCVARHTGFNLTYFKEKCIKNNNGLGIFYLLKCYKEEEIFYKYGVTSRSVEERYRYKKDLPYDYTIEYTIEDTPEVIFELEKYIKYKDDTVVRYIPSIEFEGYTECCISIEPIYIHKIYNNIKRDFI